MQVGSSRLLQDDLLIPGKEEPAKANKKGGAFYLLESWMAMGSSRVTKRYPQGV